MADAQITPRTTASQRIQRLHTESRANKSRVRDVLAKYREENGDKALKFLTPRGPQRMTSRPQTAWASIRSKTPSTADHSGNTVQSETDMSLTNQKPSQRVNNTNYIRQNGEQNNIKRGNVNWIPKMVAQNKRDEREPGNINLEASFSPELGRKINQIHHTYWSNDQQLAFCTRCQKFSGLELDDSTYICCHSDGTIASKVSSTPPSSADNGSVSPKIYRQLTEVSRQLESFRLGPRDGKSPENSFAMRKGVSAKDSRIQRPKTARSYFNQARNKSNYIRGGISSSYSLQKENTRTKSLNDARDDKPASDLSTDVYIRHCLRTYCPLLARYIHRDQLPDSSSDFNDVMSKECRDTLIDRTVFVHKNEFTSNTP